MNPSKAEQVTRWTLLSLIADWSERVAGCKFSLIPPPDLSGIINRASRIASGYRSPKTTTPTPLASIFSRIRNIKSGAVTSSTPQAYGWYRPSEFNGSPLYPEAVRPAITASDYQRLASGLWQALNPDPAGCPSDEILVIARHFLSYVPFDPDDPVPDISVFDHARASAAVAACIASYMEAQPTGKSLPSDSERVFLLVGGDFAGIQGYVYTITSKGALKTLRARSFYVELLTEHTVHEILTGCGLSRANLVTSGGGRFELLLPYTRGSMQIFRNVQRQVNDELLDRHGGRLYLAMGEAALTASEIAGGWADTEGASGLAGAVARVAQEIGREKFRRYQVYFAQDGHVPQGVVGQKCRQCDKHQPREMFAPGDDVCRVCRILEAFSPRRRSMEKLVLGSVSRECARCGQHSNKQLRVRDTELYGCEYCLASLKEGQCAVCRADDVLARIPEPGGDRREGEGTWICGFCWRLYHLGEHLPFHHQGVRIIARRADVSEMERWEAKALVRIGTVDYVIPPPGEVGEQARKAEAIWIVNGFDPAVYRGYWRGDRQTPAFPFFAATYAYAKGAQETRPPDFQTLAEGSTGSPRLGVLRMDVDSLGAIFTRGFSEQEWTLPRIGALSWQFNLFFRCYLDTMCQGRSATVVYAGGDDLFIVGAASDVVDLAREIRSSFGRFAGGNPQVTLSAGIVIQEENYPLYLLARESDEAIRRAKKFIPPGSSTAVREKDALSLFGIQLRWDDLERGMKEVASPILEHFADHYHNRYELRIPRRLIHNLLSLVHAYRTGRRRLPLPMLWWTLGRIDPSVRADPNWPESALLQLIPEGPAVVEVALKWIELLSRARE